MNKKEDVKITIDNGSKLIKISDYYTTRQAAERLGCTVSGINYLVYAGKITPTKIFNRNLFTEQELARYEVSRQRKKK